MEICAWETDLKSHLITSTWNTQEVSVHSLLKVYFPYLTSSSSSSVILIPLNDIQSVALLFNSTVQNVSHQTYLQTTGCWLMHKLQHQTATYSGTSNVSTLFVWINVRMLFVCFLEQWNLDISESKRTEQNPLIWSFWVLLYPGFTVLYFNIIHHRPINAIYSA